MAEKEFIEREAVVAFLENMAASRYLIQCFENKEKFPAADVVEVRHGEWIKHPYHKYWECNLCDGSAPVDCQKEEFYQSDFCPSCGAKMDGERKCEE